MKIRSATIIKSPTGPDTIIMTTNLPSGMWPYDGFQDIKMQVAADTAESYLAIHFPKLKPEVINLLCKQKAKS